MKLGYQALNSISSGIQNTAIGSLSMQNNVNGSSNTSIGHNSLLSNINGSNNCSFGQGTLGTCLESGNSVFGQFSISSLNNGSSNSGLGYACGKSLINGSNNTFLGSNTDLIANGTSNNSTAIGYGARITGSNQIMIGTSAETVNIPGILSVNSMNVFKTIESFTTFTYAQTMTFDFNSGMIYYLDISTLITSPTVNFINIPTTPQQSYNFTYVIKPTVNTKYYITPSSNVISINSIANIPIYGISNVSFPSTFNYIIQQITIMNTSITTTPNYISLITVSAF